MLLSDSVYKFDIASVSCLCLQSDVSISEVVVIARSPRMVTKPFLQQLFVSYISDVMVIGHYWEAWQNCCFLATCYDVSCSQHSLD